MQIHIHPDQQVLGETAGKEAAALIRTKIASTDAATIVIGSDPSLAAVLHTLSKAPGINWGKVTIYQLGEWIGVSENHKARHRKFLQDNLLNKLSGLKKASLINGETILSDELKRLNGSIQETSIDIAILGLRAQGQVGFNSEPADLKSTSPFLMVEPDTETCKSLVAAGLYRTLNEVPRRAFTMSIHQLLRSKIIICAVSGSTHTDLVSRLASEDEDVSIPAMALKNHAGLHLHVDAEAAATSPLRNS
ncbi:MAG: 6-phosphogluconolactonase [Bacteroidota bacterium]